MIPSDVDNSRLFFKLKSIYILCLVKPKCCKTSFACKVELIEHAFSHLPAGVQIEYIINMFSSREFVFQKKKGISKY